MENAQKVLGGRAQAIQLSLLAHEALPSLIMHGRCPRNQGKTTLAGVGWNELELSTIAMLSWQAWKILV